MKTYFLKPVALLAICIAWSSCSDDDSTIDNIEDPIDNTASILCEDATLNITSEVGLDIIITPSGFDASAVTSFTWSVDGEKEDSLNSDGTLSWGPGSNATEFCYTTFTDNCIEGLQQCVTFVRTNEQITAANTPVDGKLPIISVIQIEEGLFTYQINNK